MAFQRFVAPGLSACVPQITHVSGASGSGKTQFLVDKTAELLSSTCSSVAVVVANSEAAREFAERLMEQCSCLDALESGRLSLGTIHDFAVRLLSERKAYVGLCTGETALDHSEPQSARVLAAHEYRLLIEDMKTLGIKRRRLHDMLHYFYYQWSILADQDSWMLPQEERSVCDKLTALLDERNAYIPEELSPCATEYLSHCIDQGRDLPGYEAVLVDDAHNLSQASQVLIALAARTELVVTAQAEAVVEHIDAFSSPRTIQTADQYKAHLVSKMQAAQERAGLEPDVTSVVLDAPTAAYRPDAIQRAEQLLTPFESAQAQRIQKDHVLGAGYAGSLSAAQGESTPAKQQLAKDTITHIKWKDLAHERAGLADLIATRLKSPSEKERLTGHEIVIVAPHAAIARGLFRELKAHNIPARIVADKPVPSGNPLDIRTSTDLVASAFLELVACPLEEHASSLTALRTLLGAGDCLGNSTAWNQYQAYCAEQGKDSAHVMFGLEGHEFVLARVFVERLSAITSVLAEARQMRGHMLLKYLEHASREFIATTCVHTCASTAVEEDNAEPSACQLSRLLSRREGTESAHELWQLLNKVSERDVYVRVKEATDTDAVRIAMPPYVVGLNPKLLIVASAVDGFYPSRFCLDKAELEDQRICRMEHEQNQFARMIAHCCGSLVVSSLEHATLEEAETLKMYVRRVRAYQESRVALLSTSSFLEKITALCGSSVSGEQYCADRCW